LIFQKNWAELVEFTLVKQKKFQKIPICSVDKMKKIVEKTIHSYALSKYHQKKNEKKNVHVLYVG
jgi:hypothetical protein